MKEIEARFLEIDKEELVSRLVKLGAKDLGEVMLEEVIFYDPELKWREQNRFVRLRKKGGKIKLTYKQNQGQTIDSAEEIEFEVGDMQKAELLLEKVGLAAYRHQQKKRHTFELGEITIDIDTWPQIPTYLELEGPTEAAIKDIASKLELDWGTAVFDDARYIIGKRYNVPVSTMKWFTFDRFE